MGLLDGVGRVGRRVDRSVSGGCQASGSLWGVEEEDQTAGTHGWLLAAQRPACSSSHPLLQICLFISLSLGLQRADSKLALNENRDDLNEKKKANATQAAMPAALYDWTYLLFYQLALDDSTKRLNLSGSRVSSVISWTFHQGQTDVSVFSGWGMMTFSLYSLSVCFRSIIENTDLSLL